MESALKMKYDSVQEQISKLKEKQRLQESLREHYTEHLKKLELNKEEKQHALEILEKSIKVFQDVTDERNKSAKDAIETVMNWAISKIFTKQSYTFKIKEHADSRSGKTMELYLIDNITGFSRSLSNQQGTAMVQMISFLMMLTVIKLAKSSHVLIIDEGFSGFEDKNAIRMCSEILTSLAKNENFQIFIIEQDSDISDNEDFIRLNLALEDQNEGLILKSIEEIAQ